MVVVPAHDEERIITQTLESLSRALSERMRILVVADNCSDATADSARQTGQQVVVRTDPAHRGKGFALAFAAEILKPDAPDVVVVLDADCETDAHSLRVLVDRAAASHRPCQAVNLLRPSLTASPLVQISTFAFFVKNLIRQRGLQRLAGRVHLTGTGMALPFPLFEKSGEVGDSVVEDLALGLQLARTGHPSILVDDANVWSDGSTKQETLVQRRRWEGGFMAVSMRQGWPLFREGLMNFDVRTAVAGLDLMIPPLALFAALNFTVLAVGAGVSWLFTLPWWPVQIHAIALFAALAALGAVWLGEGRKFLSSSALLRIPFYVLWKLPMYVAFARRGAPKDWLRSGR